MIRGMREITVGLVAPAYVNVPLWIAQERGFLGRRGLSAAERVLGITHGVTQALRDGTVDIALGSPGAASPTRWPAAPSAWWRDSSTARRCP